MRLGDLDALKEVITANHYLLSSRNNSIDYGMFTTGIIQAIDNAPTVEYPFYQEAYQTGYEEGKNERPQGKWIVKSNGTTHYYACDKCGSAGDIQDKFCRECGADMRNITETPSSCTTTNPNSVEAYHQSLKGGAE